MADWLEKYPIGTLINSPEEQARVERIREARRNPPAPREPDYGCVEVGVSYHGPDRLEIEASGDGYDNHGWAHLDAAQVRQLIAELQQWLALREGMG